MKIKINKNFLKNFLKNKLINVIERNDLKNSEPAHQGNIK